MNEFESNNETDNRVSRLETKVNLLLALVVVQTAILFMLFMSSIIPSPATLVVMIVLTIIAVLLLNSYVPGWASFFGRMIGSTIRSFQSASRQSKKSVKEDF